MMAIVTSDMILEKTAELNLNLMSLYKVTISLNNAKFNLSARESALMASGGIEGKNAEIRKANLALETAGERLIVSGFQLESDEIRLEIEMIRNELAAYRMIVQLNEVK